MPTAMCQGYKEAMVEFEIIPLHYKAVDITGQKFNEITAIAPTNLRQSNKVIWLCQCSCGREKLIRGDSLTSGNTKSCGCRSQNGYMHKRDGKVKYFYFCRVTCPDCRLVRNVRVDNTKRKRFTGLCRKCYLNRVDLQNVARGCFPKPRASIPGYTRWRNDVFARDGYTCQKCYSVGNLASHHVFNFAQYESLQTDVDNGKTLCSRCHKTFHSRYGYTDNTPEQLVKFLMFEEDDNASSTM